MKDKKTEKPKKATTKKNTTKKEVEPKSKAGRKAHTVTEANKKSVRVLTGYGLTQEHVAASMGISVDTLTKYYHEQFVRGKANACYEVGKSLFNQAVAGNVAAAIWWTKSQMGWKDAGRVDARESAEENESKLIEALKNLSASLPN